MKKYAKIIGTGSYLPPKILTNADLEKIIDTTDEWITTRTGIKSRHIAADNETSATMGALAAKKALESAQINPDELDLILVATCTPDRFFPSTACLIQNALGITKNIPAFDISAACTGFIYALSVANQFIQTGTYKNILIIGAEVMSRTVDWTDRRVCVLFGDGAGAVVLQASDSPGIQSVHLHSDATHKDILSLPNPMVNESDNKTLSMTGNEVFKIAVKSLESITNETLGSHGSKDHIKIDWLVPHQANLRIISATAKKLNLPMSQVILTVSEHGNTSAASIPLALDQGIRDGRITENQMVLLEAFGGGLTWGSALIKI